MAQEGDSRIREYEKHGLKISLLLVLRLFKIALYRGVLVFLLGRGGLGQHVADAGVPKFISC